MTIMERGQDMDRQTGQAASVDLPGLLSAVLQARQTVLPRRLGDPGPDAGQLQAIVGAASHAPDHGQLLPWRFVLVPQDGRERLADAFATALRERDPAATPEQLAQAQEKAHRAPVLLLVVVNGVSGDPEIDLHERLVSAGCAVQNVLLMATALGFGSALTSGKALKSASLRSLFGLVEGEHALCFVSLGTVLSRKPAKPRPGIDDYFCTLASQGNGAPLAGASGHGAEVNRKTAGSRLEPSEKPHGT